MENAGVEVWQFHWGLFEILNSVDVFCWTKFAFSCLQVEVDARSVYVGNVDYGATAEELEQLFHGCGSINRVTILCNKFDGNPKGFAYVEFTDKDSVDTAMALDDSLFRGRQIKVLKYITDNNQI